MHTLTHRILRRLHLCIALPLALFLIVQGLTGSAIVWIHELDVFLNPQLLQVQVNENEAPQTPSTLLARLNKLPGYAQPYMLTLPQKKNDVLIAWYKIPSVEGKTKLSRQVMVNPYSGVIIGERNWGETGFTRPLLMSTLFHLHRYLLAGETGKTLVAIQGILLAIIAVSGIYLWWPVWRVRAWWHAITVSRVSSWKHFNVRLHRAAGFYAAPVFLMLALTGVYLNKPQWILPIVEQFTQQVNKKPAVRNFPTEHKQTLPLEEILNIARQQFPTAQITRVNLSDAKYDIRLHQPDELREYTGATRISIDKQGNIIKIQDPLNATHWDLISSYFFPLHSGQIFGMASKVLMSLFGLMPLFFAISGTLIWLKRRGGRNQPHQPTNFMHHV